MTRVCKGCIKAITEVECVVSLPDGLTGFVSLREVSDVMQELVDRYVDDNEDGESIELPEMADMFHVGQLVRVAVVKLEKETKKGTLAKHIE